MKNSGLTTYLELKEHTSAYFKQFVPHFNEEYIISAASIEDLIGEEIAGFIVRSFDDQDITHVTLMLRLKEDHIHFFDSTGKDCESLHNLCKILGYKYTYNKTQLQELDSFVCGYWCIARLQACNNDEEKWKKIFTANRSIKKPDDVLRNLLSIMVFSDDLKEYNELSDKQE